MKNIKYILIVIFFGFLVIALKGNLYNSNQKSLEDSRTALKNADPKNLTEEDKKHMDNIVDKTITNYALKR